MFALIKKKVANANEKVAVSLALDQHKQQHQHSGTAVPISSAGRALFE